MKLSPAPLIDSGKPTQPDFSNALQTQRVWNAVLQSAREGRWVETKVELPASAAAV